jgi:hypothetical protein
MPLCVLVAFTPINYLILGKFGVIEGAIMQFKDKRINKLSEILQVICG